MTCDNERVVRQKQFVQFGVPVVAVGLATGGTMGLLLLTGITLFVLYAVAVSVTVLTVGRGPGVLAVVLSAAVSDYLFLEPKYVLTLGVFTGLLFGAYGIPVLVGRRPATAADRCCPRASDARR